MIKIKKFEDANAVQLSSLIIRNLYEVNIKDYKKEILDELAREEYNPDEIINKSKKSEILVVFKGDQIIGTGRLEKNWIYDVFVLPEFHNQGIGKEIMQELEAIAKSKVYAKIKLPSSITALTFYEKLGYKATNKRTKSSRIMEKKIRTMAKR